MKASKFIIAAGFALATTGAFAETGVRTYQIDNVANIYARAEVPTVAFAGNVATQSGQAADSGRNIIKGDTKIAVPAGRDAVEFGRS